MADANANGYYPVSPLVNVVVAVREELINCLKQYFAKQEPPFLRYETPNQEEARLLGATYSPTPSRHALFIADSYPNVPGGTDYRPAIIVQRGDVVDEETGIMDNRTLGSFAEERVKRSWGLIMPTLFHCVSQYELQAEDLCWTARAVMRTYYDQIAAFTDTIEEMEGIAMKEVEPYNPANGGSSGKGDWHDAPVAIQWRLRSDFVQQNMSGVPTQQVEARLQ